MRKLLSAQLGRLGKDRAFWVLAALTAAYAVAVCVVGYRSMVLHDVAISFEQIFLSCFGLAGYIALPGIMLAVLCSLFVGTEFSDGAIRNKLIVGHTRGQIYVSNFLVCTAGALALTVVYGLIACALGIPLFGGFTAPPEYLLPLVLSGVMMLVSYVALFTLLATLIQNRSITSVVCLVATFVVMFWALYTISMLNQPEFYDWVEIIDGEAVTQTVRNTNYLTGNDRLIQRFLVDLAPSGQSLQISGMSAPNLWRLPLLSLAVAVLANVAGVLTFRKRDLK